MAYKHEYVRSHGTVPAQVTELDGVALAVCRWWCPSWSWTASGWWPSSCCSRTRTPSSLPGPSALTVPTSPGTLTRVSSPFSLMFYFLILPFGVLLGNAIAGLWSHQYLSSLCLVYNFFFMFLSVLRIRDILVRIRIRIRILLFSSTLTKKCFY